MDPGAIGARLASSMVAPLVKKLFVQEGPGAGLVDKPVRISSLVSFSGERRTLTENDLRKLARTLVRAAGQSAGPHDALPDTETEAVTDALVRTLNALGDLTLDDVEAVQLGHKALARTLQERAGGFDVTLPLSGDAAALYHRVLESACLHVLHFFTQRSTFVARTLVEQSGRLADLVARTDVLIERLPSRSAEDLRFEERYADYVAKRHSRLTIYGVDLRQAREWPLEVAYLSLEAVGAEAAEPEGPGWRPAPVQPVDQALAGHERVLLRGVAGSGKTTLVQWLAVTTARQDKLTGHDAHLLGRVPFVLPLRTLTRGGAPLPPPQDFLSGVGCPLAGSQPHGWADRVLTAGRALLLVDGVDEVPEQERERTRRWLYDLVTAFPGNRFVVTSRPSAVREDWLHGEDFTELSLSAMRTEDVAVFVRRWHHAAQAGPELEQALLDALRTKPDLGRLATNPLMCGLICALHRERRGFLPRGRKALYDAALSMLLERRDRERDMDTRDGIELDAESQTELLQKLAYWLIRNGRSEMAREDAVQLLTRVFPLMPHVAAQGSADDVYRHLLVRSGLLREPARDTVDFVHRTFQDYLGARAAVEERDFDLLTGHAHLDQWEDVVRMAVAHARPDERTRLLRALVQRGDDEPEVRTRLHLLATACLEHATKLDPQVRADVEQRASALIPPRSFDEAEALAGVGPVVLELLPGPEGLEDDEAEAVARTAAQVGGDSALTLLERFLDHEHGGVLHQLGAHWDRFDTDEYGQRIITRLAGRSEAAVIVRTAEELTALTRMDGHQRVWLRGDFAAEDISGALAGDTLTALTLAQNSVLDSLGFLSAFPHLTSLDFDGCSGVFDLSPLGDVGLRRLRAIDIGELCGLERLTGLEELILRGDLPWPGLSALAPLESLTSLWLPYSEQDLAGIESFPGLRELNLVDVRARLGHAAWTAVAALPHLETLMVDSHQYGGLVESGTTLSQVSQLVLLCDGDACDTRQIVRLFPSLAKLTVSRPSAETDLSPLAELPGLTSVSISRPSAGLDLGGLPSEVELTVTPRPRNTCPTRTRGAGHSG